VLCLKVGLKEVTPIEVAIIGGSGLYAILENPKYIFVNTPFGRSPRIEIGEIDGVRVAFLPRHAAPGSTKVTHAIPPAMVNYRANVYALRKLGVERILTSQACGAINPVIKPGTLVIIDQFIDETKNRVYSFYDGKTPIQVWPDKPPIKTVVHIDVTQPYCPELRAVLIKACEELNIHHINTGTYICTDGPRFETSAEIRAYKLLGADVVGMTNIPECVLARELTMCYASIAMATNYAAGTGPIKITHEEVTRIFAENIGNVQKVFRKAVKLIPRKRECACKNALVGAVA